MLLNIQDRKSDFRKIHIWFRGEPYEVISHHKNIQFLFFNFNLRKKSPEGKDAKCFFKTNEAINS